MNLEIQKGDFTVIMGNSGSGKSTLLYALSGMDRPTLGSIAYQGEEISHYTNDQLAVFRRNHCGFVFQQNYLNDTMSVLDNVMVAGLLVQKDRKALASRAKELLLQVGLSETIFNKFPTQLSGGEQQRAALVRGIINTPEILFADEPTGALNSQNTEAVLNVLTQLYENGQSIVMVTHDMKSARRGNRILYLKDGMITGELNLKNVGILQAVGYTVRQLKLVSVFEMGIIALFGIVTGMVFGMLGNDAIGNLQGRLIGIAWNQAFQLKTAIIIAIISFAAIIGVTGMISAVYGKVSVLDALRGGIRAHNFRKNYFSFEKTCLPKSMVLAGKNLLGEKVKNFSILCIIIVLSFATCTGFVLYQNFAGNTDYLLKVVGSETGNITVTGDMQKLETIGEKLEEWEEVEKVLYYDNCTVQLSKAEKKRTVVCDIWKNPELNENEMLITGRLPKYDNEIILTVGSAKALSADVGDIIYVEGRNGKKDYIITGIDQKINQMGMKALITMEGAKRLNGSTQIASLYVHTKEGITFNDIAAQIEAEFPEIGTQDTEKMVNETVSGVVTGITVICIVFVIVTLLVVTMVEILLVRSKIIKERRNYGINKALGYTTRQLMVEMMMMNIPVVTFGAILGAVLCLFLTNSLIAVCLSSCGIAKCDMTISPEWLLLTVVGIVLVAAVVSFLSAVRIRKIEPVKMLTEE